MATKYNVKPKIKLVSDSGEIITSGKLAAFVVDFITVKTFKIHFKKAGLSQADTCRAKNKALTHVRRWAGLVGITRVPNRAFGMYNRGTISFLLLTKHLNDALIAKTSDDFHRLLREPMGA
jgi:hypothetical protein